MSPGLTEREELALRRMEQLTALRRAARWPDWRAYMVFVWHLPMPAFFIYRFCNDPITKFSIGLMILAVLWVVLDFAFLFIVTPMKRRIDALTQLLEEEIKRNR